MTSNVQSNDVIFAFNQFFTSVNLLLTIDFPCFEICMANRENMPKFEVPILKNHKGDKPVSSKLKKSEHVRTNKKGILASR